MTNVKEAILLMIMKSRGEVAGKVYICCHLHMDGLSSRRLVRSPTEINGGRYLHTF
jgi:hypothetical protein